MGARRGRGMPQCRGRHGSLACPPCGWITLSLASQADLRYDEDVGLGAVPPLGPAERLAGVLGSAWKKLGDFAREREAARAEKDDSMAALVRGKQDQMRRDLTAASAHFG